MVSCCCSSRQTSVFGRWGSFVVSVIRSCKNVDKFFSVSHIALPRSQLFGFSALTQGAWPIFTFWMMLLTPTYFAQFIAGISIQLATLFSPPPLGCNVSGLMFPVIRVLAVVGGLFPRMGRLSISAVSVFVVGSLLFVEFLWFQFLYRLL